MKGLKQRIGEFFEAISASEGERLSGTAEQAVALLSEVLDGEVAIDRKDFSSAEAYARALLSCAGSVSSRAYRLCIFELLMEVKKFEYEEARAILLEAAREASCAGDQTRRQEANDALAALQNTRLKTLIEPARHEEWIELMALRDGDEEGDVLLPFGADGGITRQRKEEK